MSETESINIKSHVADQKTSGLSRMAYCRKHGISYHTFNYYYRRQEPANSQEGFIHVKACNAKPTEGFIELHLGNGKFFRFDSKLPDVAVKRLLGVC